MATLKMNPEETGELIINPGKGWVLYGTERFWENSQAPFAGQSDETWALGSVGYFRYSWSEIEPTENEFNWDYIDRALEECTKRGKRFGFGVMSVNTCKNTEFVTPRYVFDSGAKYTLSQCRDMFTGASFYQRVPIYSDPIYQDKVFQFAVALKNRYGHNPAIAFIDIRCYGTWGENSMFDIEDRYQPRLDTGVCGAEMQTCWKLYLDAFAGTPAQLIVAYGLVCNEDRDYCCYDNYQWAVNNGIGIRRDAIMSTNICYGKECAWAYGKAPGIFEFVGSYPYCKQKGGYDNGRLLRSVEEGKPTYCCLGMWGADSQEFLHQERPIIEKINNLLGYHFVLKTAEISFSPGTQKAGEIVLEWLNKGVAPIYIPCHVALALIDENGNISKPFWLEGSNPKKWLPGQEIQERMSFDFGEHSFETSQLALGLFTSRALINPDIRIGIKGRLPNGWYPLNMKD